MKQYLLKRPNGDVIVSLIRCISDGKFHFINITKGRAYEFGFDSEEDAMNDLKENYIEKGLVTEVILLPE